MSEDPKQKFDIDKAAFDQNCNQIRAHISELHKLPTQSVIITGGLWAFAVSGGVFSPAATQLDPTQKGWVQILVCVVAAIVNIFMALSVLRLRDVLQAYIEKASEFTSDFGKPGGRPKRPVLAGLGNYSMALGYSLMMLFASLGSFVLAWILTHWHLTVAIVALISWTPMALYAYLAERVMGRSESSASKSTIGYYNKNHEEYFKTRHNLDMSYHVNKFLSYLPPVGHILEIGAGTGRDAADFLKRGYAVTAIEPSLEMRKYLDKIENLEISSSTAESMSYEGVFDAVWACTSLLHVSKLDMPIAFKNIISALKRGGCAYISFRNGDQERDAGDGRTFTDMNASELVKLQDKLGSFDILEIYVTQPLVESSHSRNDVFNAIIRKR